MKMTWDSEAEKMLQRVPFFVRKRVRTKVEELLSLPDFFYLFYVPV